MQWKQYNFVVDRFEFKLDFFINEYLDFKDVI